VRKQQNWRFKAYMLDLISGIATIEREHHHKFIRYNPPDRLLMLGITKNIREEMKILYEKIGKYAHCSTNVVKKCYLPYMRIILKHKRPSGGGLELTEDDIKNITGK
jgi:hypothetical protein